MHLLNLLYGTKFSTEIAILLRLQKNLLVCYLRESEKMIIFFMLD